MRCALFKINNVFGSELLGRVSVMNIYTFWIIISLILSQCFIQTVDGAWSKNTEEYFGNEVLDLRITSIADWNNSMEIGFFGTLGMHREKLLWYCRANSASTLYTKCWESLDFPAPIVSTIVVDLNRNGHLDILVQCENAMVYFIDGSERNAHPVQLHGWPAFNGTLPLVSLASIFSTCGLTDIALVDLNGSLIIMRGTTLMVDRSCNGYGVPTYESLVLVPGEKQKREVVPLSLSSDDINGDCAVEFLYMVHDLVSDSLEIYSFFPLEDRHELLLTLQPAGFYGTPAFADVDGDGAPDIIIPTCAAPSSFGSCALFDGLTVFFNALRGTFPCSRRGCCERHLYGFSARSSGNFSLADAAACGLSPAALGMPHAAAAPLTLRFGDFNRDGRADLLVPSTRGPLLLAAQPRGSANGLFVCSALVEDAAGDSNGTRSAQAVPFFADISGRMIYDVVLTSHGVDALPVAVFMNDAFSNENYFMASSALNGAADMNAWGAYQPSAVHRFAWNDVSMRKRLAYGVQLSKTQGHSLQSSILLLGLSQTFSYVQDYAVGIIADKELRLRQWSMYHIPDSKVFIWLHPPFSAHKWHLRLYIVFNTYTKHFLLVLSVALTIIGIPIVILKFREVKQDRREWKFR